jgi:DNA helicase-2/ATP-dependent DNA helicase PcrA
MDKRVIFAVAGSGKTTEIVSKLNLNKRFLIITYTTNNVLTLRSYIINKFNYFPENIRLYSYFTFLYSFCLKPLLSFRIKQKGINWKQPPEHTKLLGFAHQDFYIDNNRRLYHNRIAKLLEAQNVFDDVNNRIKKYFDYLLIDEIQDFSGHDFNFLKSLVKGNYEILFVGDFYQNTFDTSKDGNLNTGKNFEDYSKYKKLFEKMGLHVDTKTLLKSRRCSKTICGFIKNNLGIDIDSYDDRNSIITVIDNHEDAVNIVKNDLIIKLFFKEHHKHNFFSENWGKSKGMTYKDVCVVLNKTTQQKFETNDLSSLAPQTKNKFYVACTRASNNLYFVSDKFIQ